MDMAEGMIRFLLFSCGVMLALNFASLIVHIADPIQIGRVQVASGEWECVEINGNWACAAIEVTD